MNEEQKMIVESINKTILVLDDHMRDVDDYRMMVENYYEAIKAGYEHKELRECGVRFQFHEGEDQPIHILQLRHFVTNLFLWEPYARLEMYPDMDETCIVDCSKITTDTIKEFLDVKIIEPYRSGTGNYKMNKICHDVIFNLGRISSDFNELLGLTINIESFIQIADRNPRFNELIRTKIDDSMQPSDVEKHLNELTDETIEILSEEIGALKPILRSGTGIKSGQLKEFTINGGYKPDLSGNTIPIVVNSNFVVGGLSNVVNYYIDAIGGRKAIIMNSTVMGVSGHFTRMILLLATELKLNNEQPHDCGTIHGVQFVVRTKKHLEKIVGRYHRQYHTRKYTPIRSTDTHLIGETIIMRTPAKCADERICSTCYGDLWYTNRDLESAGGHSATKVTEPVSQSILSSKHLLTTNSERITFNNSLFTDLFKVDANEISIITGDFDADLSKYEIVIIKDNIHKIDAFDDMEVEYNSFVKLFHILDRETGELIEMISDNGADLYIGPEFEDIMREVSKQKPKRGKKANQTAIPNSLSVPLEMFGPSDRLFVVEVENNELTKPLYSIMHLLDNREKREADGVFTIDQAVQHMVDLLIESKISAVSVHGEMMIRCLVRSKKNVLELPNFRTFGVDDDVELMTIKSALEKHPSVTVAMSFQYVNRQLQTPLTFSKHKPSYIDVFFDDNVKL